MKSIVKPMGVLAAVLALAGGAAVAAGTQGAGPDAVAAELQGMQVGTTEGEIASALKAKGYEVSGFETEKGELEAEITRNGMEYEVAIDPATGTIVEVEQED